MYKKKMRKRVRASSCTRPQNLKHTETIMEDVFEVVITMAEGEDAIGRIGTVEAAADHIGKVEIHRRSCVSDVIN